MKNKWKVLFFLLLGVNISVMVSLFILVTLPSKEGIPPLKGEELDYVQLKVTSSKNDLNRMINHYIEQEYSNSPIDYEVVLQDEVELYGTVRVFNEDIEMKLTFEPASLENGDFLLRKSTISLGRLQLPTKYVMQFLKEQYEFPEWITIYPNDESVYVAVQKLKLKSEMRVKVERFDLKNNDISFVLMVPTNNGS